MTSQNSTNNFPMPTSCTHFYGYGGVIYNGNIIKSIDPAFNSAYEFARYARVLNDAINDCYQFECVLAKGSYQFLVIHDTDIYRGIVSLYLNDVLFGTLDCYSSSRINVNRTTFPLNIPASGNQVFKVKVASKNSRGQSYQFGCSVIIIHQTPPTTILVNSGGSNYTDSLGRLWVADNYFTGGTAWNIEQYTGVYSVSGTNDPTIYKFERSLDTGTFSYSIPIVSGIYDLKLHFSENNKTASGQRVGTVALNGSNLLSNFDIYAQTGGQHKALIKTFTNQSLSAFTLTITNTLINGIELIKAA